MKRVISAAAVAAGLVLTTACSHSDGQPSMSIGIKYDQPGMSVMGSDGKPHGFDVDTATYIAGALGVSPDHITWKRADSGRREALLSSGAVDFVAASYSITADRAKQVSFAGPYLVTGQDLLVRRDEPGIGRPEDLNGRTVCTATGSTSADKIKKNFAADVRLTTRDTYSSCVDDLLSGRSDAVTTDGVILAGYAAQHRGELRVVNHPFTRERYGIGVKKGDTALQGKITDAIRTMIGDGSWQRSVDADIAPSGYRMPPPPAVFNAPDATLTTAGAAELDPALVETVNALAGTSNAQNWDAFNGMVCPGAADAINQLVTQYTPQYDPNLGPEVKDAGFTNAITGITQTGPDAATFLAHESFTNVPEKYRQYFKDIDYTGTMSRRDGSWKLCSLAADFVEP